MGEEDKLLILGIQSVDSPASFAKRQAARETFLSERQFEYRFIFDRETPTLLREQEKWGDCVFLGRKSSGWAVAFGEVELLWLKYCREHFPTYALYGKADDDTFICPKPFVQNLRQIATRRLFYGWWHWHQW